MGRIFRIIWLLAGFDRDGHKVHRPRWHWHCNDEGGGAGHGECNIPSEVHVVVRSAPGSKPGDGYF